MKHLDLLALAFVILHLTAPLRAEEKPEPPVCDRVQPSGSEAQASVRAWMAGNEVTVQ